MNIQIDPHTLERAEERGVSENEIRETILTGSLFNAKKGRLGRVKVFSFDNVRAGKYYPQKRVEVVFVEEGAVIVTVTVYVFYGKWES